MKVQDKEKTRQKYVSPYRKRFANALLLQLEPVLDAIRTSYNPQYVLDEVESLIKIDPLLDVYEKCYPEVGTEAAMLNIDQINRDLRSQKNYKRKDEIEDLWARYLRDYIDTTGMQRIVSVTNTSRSLALQAIERAIREALENGQSPYEAQRQIEESVLQEWRRTNVFRADRIARTEVYTAYSLADFQSAQSYQIPLLKEWVHGFIGKDDRPGHIALSGVQTGLNDRFQNPATGASLMHPHDFNGAASEVINCKCSMIYNERR